MRPLPDFTTEIWFPDHASDYSPAGCFYDAKEIDELARKYHAVFDTYRNVVEVKDDSAIAFRLVAQTFSHIEINPDDSDTYTDFDWVEEGWRVSGVTFDRFNSIYLGFYQKHCSDILQVMFK